MKHVACFVLALLLFTAASGQAGGLERSVNLFALRPIVDVPPARDSFGRPLEARPRQPRISRAMDEAWKRDAAEENLKGWAEVLAKCQQATNPAWSTALVRSEPQQAHCYNY